jgi:hypothetical protein
MKKIALTLIVLVITFTHTFAGTPPSDVLSTFKKMYPSASKVTWGKEKSDAWQAEFVNEGYTMEALFTEKGTWLHSKTTVRTTNLPSGIKEAIRTRYTGWEATAANKTESALEGSQYEVVLKMGADTKSFTFKEDGTSIEK